MLPNIKIIIVIILQANWTKMLMKPVFFSKHYQ